jgi:hypothetical protein
LLASPPSADSQSSASSRKVNKPAKKINSKGTSRSESPIDDELFEDAPDELPGSENINSQEEDEDEDDDYNDNNDGEDDLDDEDLLRDPDQLLRLAPASAKHEHQISKAAAEKDVDEAIAGGYRQVSGLGGRFVHTFCFQVCVLWLMCWFVHASSSETSAPQSRSLLDRHESATTVQFRDFSSPPSGRKRARSEEEEEEDDEEPLVKKRRDKGKGRIKREYGRMISEEEIISVYID